MGNKNSILVAGIVAVVLVVLYQVDKRVWMEKRVLRHNLWEWNNGEMLVGDFLETQNSKFHGDTLIIHYEYSHPDTVIFRRQHFNTIVIMDPKTRKRGRYTMKGANFLNYTFRKEQMIRKYEKEP